MSARSDPIDESRRVDGDLAELLRRARFPRWLVVALVAFATLVVVAVTVIFLFLAASDRRQEKQADRIEALIADQAADRDAGERRSCEQSNAGRAGITDAFDRFIDALGVLLTTDEGTAFLADLRVQVHNALPAPDRDCNGDGHVDEEDYP